MYRIEQIRKRSSYGRRELDIAFDGLKEIIIDGLRHGFFEYSISGEIVKDHKRRLTIKAGKSHQFIIPEQELN